MSHISAQTRFLEDCFADFESFLEEGNYSDARAVIANLEQKKYYGVAQMFSRKLNLKEAYRPEDDFGGKSGQATDPWVASEERSQDIDSHIYAQADY